MRHLNPGSNERHNDNNSVCAKTKRYASRFVPFAILLVALSPVLNTLYGQDKQQTPGGAANKFLDEGTTLANEGSESSLRQAIKKLESALQAYRSLKDHFSEATALNLIGKVYDDLGEKRSALNYFNQALQVARESHDRRGESGLLSSLGDTYRDLEENEKALQYYEEALSASRLAKDRDDESYALNRLGEMYKEAKDLPKALRYGNQALSIARTDSNQIGEANALITIGSIYDDLGEERKALEYLNPALSLSRELRDRDKEAATLHYLGSVYANLGELERGLDYLNQALAIWQSMPDRTRQCSTLNSIAGVYLSLGVWWKSIEYLDREAKIRRDVGDHRGESASDNNIGQVYFTFGATQKALIHYLLALRVAQATNDRPGQAVIFSNLGQVYDAMGKQRTALGYYGQSLLLMRQLDDLKGGSITLNNMGHAYQALGNTAMAVKYFNEALTLSRIVDYRTGEATTLGNLMGAWKVKNVALAIFYGKQAVNTYQQLRENIIGLDKNIQEKFLQSKEDTYHVLLELLISVGRLAEAEQVLALLKQKEYFGYVRVDETALSLLDRADLTQKEKDAARRYDEGSARIADVVSEFNDLKVRRVSSDDPRYKSLQVAIDTNQTTFLDLLQKLAIEFGKQNQTSRALEGITSLRSDLKRWGDGTVALYTIVGEDNYRVVLTTPTLQIVRKAKPEIRPKQLNELVLAFRDALQNRDVDPRPLGQLLYKILLKPVEKDLKAAGAKRLVWSLDGTLRYLPIAALYDGQQYVVERYENVIITLASRTRLDETPSNHWRGLGLGVSKGVVEKWGTFAPLPWVPAELREIISDETQTSVATGLLPGRVLLDEAFTEATMKLALDESRYPLVHIASHFKFNPGIVNNSFLVLGDGNRLTLDHLRGSAGLTFRGVELLTLSACDTASGGGANGEEVEGFAVLAQQQGASAVLGSLWPVDDESTKLLMQKFYEQRMTKPGMTKAEALRLAQLALLRPPVTGPGVRTSGRASTSADEAEETPPFIRDPNAPFAHPYFWAPFILVGNWK